MSIVILRFNKIDTIRHIRKLQSKTNTATQKATKSPPMLAGVVSVVGGGFVEKCFCEGVE